MTTAREIADALAARIEAGEWPREGDEKRRRFLTREQVKADYGTTLATVDAAIRVLRVRGLIVTRPGGGTFIRPPKPLRVVAPGGGGTWTQSEPTTEVLCAFSWVKDELDLSAQDDVYRVRRVISRDGEVYGLLDTYTATEGAEVETVEETAPAHRVRTWLPSDEEAQLLGMPQEVPVLALLNRVAGGAVVRIFPGDRLEYRP